MLVRITDGSKSIPKCLMAINYLAKGFVPPIGVKGSFKDAR